MLWAQPGLADRLNPRVQRFGQHQGTAERCRPPNAGASTSTVNAIIFVKNLHHPNGAQGSQRFWKSGAALMRAANAFTAIFCQRRLAKAQPCALSAQGIFRGTSQAAKRPRTDTQVTTRESPVPPRDNEAVSSHPKDRPWTTRFLPSKNVKRSTGRWFTFPFLRHCDTTSCDAHSSNATGTVRLIAARGDPPEQWIACAQAARCGQLHLHLGQADHADYVEPGIWFGT